MSDAHTASIACSGTYRLAAVRGVRSSPAPGAAERPHRPEVSHLLPARVRGWGRSCDRNRASASSSSVAAASPVVAATVWARDSHRPLRAQRAWRPATVPRSRDWTPSSRHRRPAGAPGEPEEGRAPRGAVLRALADRPVQYPPRVRRQARMTDTHLPRGEAARRIGGLHSARCVEDVPPRSPRRSCATPNRCRGAGSRRGDAAQRARAARACHRLLSAAAARRYPVVASPGVAEDVPARARGPRQRHGPAAAVDSGELRGASRRPLAEYGRCVCKPLCRGGVTTQTRNHVPAHRLGRDGLDYSARLSAPIDSRRSRAPWRVR